MWFDRIVHLWQDTTWNQIDLFFLFRCKLQPGFINGLVQVCLAAQPILRFCSPNKLEDCFVTDQRFSGPVAADLQKQAMLNRIPLGSACGQMCHCDRQAKFVRQLLQLILPSPATIAIRIAAIRFNQQFMLVKVIHLPELQPPASNGCDSKLQCLVRGPHHNEPFVVRQVVNPEGDRHTGSCTGKVILHHCTSLPPLGAASVLEVPERHAFLRIDTDYRLAGFEEAVAQPGKIAHLPVTLRVLLFGQPLAIDADRISSFPQQPMEGEGADFEALASQRSRERAQRLARPLQAGDQITRRSILQQLLQGFQSLWPFFSLAGQPAPARRTRPAVARFARWTSARSRQMVLRLTPVISISRAMPLRPHWSTSSPRRRRRFFSSRPAVTRLIAWCSLAMAL
jgi:hypothetical protein